MCIKSDLLTLTMSNDRMQIGVVNFAVVVGLKLKCK